MMYTTSLYCDQDLARELVGFDYLPGHVPYLTINNIANLPGNLSQVQVFDRSEFADLHLYL